MGPFGLVSNLWRYIADGIAWLAGHIPGIPFLGDWMEDRLDDFAGWLYQVAIFFAELDDWFWTIVDFIGHIPENIINVWQYLIDKVEPMWDWFKDFASWVGGLMNDAWQLVENGMSIVFGLMKDWVIPYVGDQVGWLSRFIFDAINDVYKSINERFAPFQAVLDFFQEFGQQFLDFFDDPVQFIAAALDRVLEVFLHTAGWPLLYLIETFLVRMWDEED